MKQGLFRRLMVAGLFFLPSSALFAILSMNGEAFVVEQYMNAADRDLNTMRAAIEEKWAEVLRVADAYQNSSLTQPTGRLDTISAALRAISQSAVLIGHVSLFDQQQKLVSSSNNEFLTFAAQREGVHPGIAKWPLADVLQGKSVARLGAGDYESFYLLPVKNQAGALVGVLALEIDTQRLAAIATGYMSQADLGFRLSIDDQALIENGAVEATTSASKGSIWWPQLAESARLTLPLASEFAGSKAVSLTLNRDLGPAQELVTRLRLVVLGTSCATALLFFLGVLWAGSRRRSEPLATSSVAGDVRITPISAHPSQFEYDVPEQPDQDRRAS